MSTSPTDSSSSAGDEPLGQPASPLGGRGAASSPPLLQEFSLEFYAHLTYPPGHASRLSKKRPSLLAAMEQEEQLSDSSADSSEDSSEDSSKDSSEDSSEDSSDSSEDSSKGSSNSASTLHGEVGSITSPVEWEAMSAKEYQMRPRRGHVNYNVNKVLVEMSKQKISRPQKRKRAVSADLARKRMRPAAVDRPRKSSAKKDPQAERAEEDLVLHRPVEIRHLLLQGVLPGKKGGHVAGRHICTPMRGCNHPVLTKARGVVSTKTKY